MQNANIGDIFLSVKAIQSLWNGPWAMAIPSVVANRFIKTSCEERSDTAISLYPIRTKTLQTGLSDKGRILPEMGWPSTMTALTPDSAPPGFLTSIL